MASCPREISCHQPKTIHICRRKRSSCPQSSVYSVLNTQRCTSRPLFISSMRGRGGQCVPVTPACRKEIQCRDRNETKRIIRTNDGQIMVCTGPKANNYTACGRICTSKPVCGRVCRKIGNKSERKEPEYECMELAVEECELEDHDYDECDTVVCVSDTPTLKVSKSKEPSAKNKSAVKFIVNGCIKKLIREDEEFDECAPTKPKPTQKNSEQTLPVQKRIVNYVIGDSSEENESDIIVITKPKKKSSRSKPTLSKVQGTLGTCSESVECTPVAPAVQDYSCFQVCPATDCCKMTQPSQQDAKMMQCYPECYCKPVSPSQNSSRTACCMSAASPQQCGTTVGSTSAQPVQQCCRTTPMSSCQLCCRTDRRMPVPPPPQCYKTVCNVSDPVPLQHCKMHCGMSPSPSLQSVNRFCCKPTPPSCQSARPAHDLRSSQASRTSVNQEQTKSGSKTCQGQQQPKSSPSTNQPRHLDQTQNFESVSPGTWFNQSQTECVMNDWECAIPECDEEYQPSFCQQWATSVDPMTAKSELNLEQLCGEPSAEPCQPCLPCQQMSISQSFYKPCLVDTGSDPIDIHCEELPYSRLKTRHMSILNISGRKTRDYNPFIS